MVCRRILTCGALALAAVLAAGCPRRAESPSSTSSPGARTPTYPAGGRRPAQVRDLSQFTTGDFEGCPPEGSGGDAQLNRLKNRDLPPPEYEPVTIAELLANNPPSLVAAGRRDRDNWPQTALAEAIQWESRGVAMDGYLLRARQQDPESCNCKDKTKPDYHVWIGESPEADRSSSVVVEVSPRLLPSHPNWRLRILSRLARDRARVRISGWLMWDQEHPEEVGKSRGTQWEIHPIHVIEVWSGGRWRNLDG